VAGEAIADGIQERRSRIVRPRRWTALSVLRGITEPLTDIRLRRNRDTQELLRELDARAERGIAQDS
jgi:hypothetical protein